MSKAKKIKIIYGLQRANDEWYWYITKPNGISYHSPTYFYKPFAKKALELEVKHIKLDYGLEWNIIEKRDDQPLLITNV